MENVNNISEQEAFDKYAELVEEKDGTNFSYDEFLKTFEDSSDSSEDGDKSQNVEEPHEKQLSPDTGTSAKQTAAPAGQTENSDNASESFVDYQKLYEQNRQQYESQLRLANSRLQDVSAKYQELKEKATSKERQPEPEQVSPKLQEFYESYPDIAEAVKTLVDSKLNSTVSQVDQLVSSKVRPLEETVVRSSANQHYERIKAAHPDVFALVESGELANWMNSLPPVEQNGAKYVYTQGTADEIISLLDMFKSSKRAGRKAAPSSAMAPAGSSPQNSQEDSTNEIVSRVLAAMSVPTSKDPIELKRGKTEKTFDDAVKEFERTRSPRR